MSETKLEKVNDRLYHQPYGEGSQFKWEKRLSFVTVTLTDIQTRLCLSIERPETSIRSLFNEVIHDGEGTYKTEQDGPGTSTKNEDGQYSQSFGWFILAKGYLNEDTIGLIRKDGIASGRAQFGSADVTLRAVADSEKEKACGWVSYNDAEFDREKSEPYIHLELFVPKIQFDQICEELFSSHLSGLELGAHIDTFESEVDYSLREPDMPKTVYIEEDSIWNRAYLSWLAGTRSISSGVSTKSPSSGDVSSVNPSDPKELFEKEGFYEQKINYFGKWLIGVEDGFHSASNALYKTIVYVAIVYLAYSVLTWLLR